MENLESKLISKVGDPYLEELNKLREKQICEVRGG